MKLINFLAIPIIILSFISCGKDNSTDTTTPTSETFRGINGQHTQLSNEITNNFWCHNVPIYRCDSNSENCTPTGETSLLRYDFIESGSLSVSEENEIVSTGQWQLNANYITLKWDDNTEVFRNIPIQIINDNEVRLGDDENQIVFFKCN